MMRRTRTFNIGSHIWFYLHFDNDGKMCGLEEHDWREGGNIGQDHGKSWEETFVEHAVIRVFGDDNKVNTRLAAQSFLVSSMTDDNVDAIIRSIKKESA